MRDYFLLQFKLNNRKLDDFGIHPLPAYLILILSFVLFSNYLFSNTEYAIPFYLIIAVSATGKLGERKRNYFLNTIFTRKRYLKLRIIENLIQVSPFIIYLCYKKLFNLSLLLLLGSVMLIFLKTSSKNNIVIPSPFGKKPFEFTIGFRKTFFLFPIAYTLSIISVLVNNFNLGIFSMLIISLTSISYYTSVENHYYIWIHNLSPKGFLEEKIRTGLIYATILNAPIVILLGFFFSEYLLIILVFYMLSFPYFLLIVFAKYSAYPKEINLPQVFSILICFVFPPFLVVIIPMLYKKSITQLKMLLHD